MVGNIEERIICDMWKLYEIYILMYIKFWDMVVLIHLHIVYKHSGYSGRTDLQATEYKLFTI